jgi:zinc protease
MGTPAADCRGQPAAEDAVTMPVARRSPVAFALAVALSVSVVAGCRDSHHAAAADPDPLRTLSLPVEQYDLANGLHVILNRVPDAATVSTNIAYHVGAANETAGSTGFAHLFEHMMFTGSGHIPAKKMDKLVDAVGSYTNAYTTFDYTHFYIPGLPPNRLALALWFESDRMGYLLDRLDAGQLATQQAVVRNERRENSEQAPYALTDGEVYHRLFPKTHPYYGNVIGSHADIQAATLARVQKFFRTYYVPNNASLVLSGNFDPGQARAQIEKYFGTIPRGADPPKPAITVPTLSAEKRVHLTDAVSAPRLTMAWLTPAYFAPGDAEADLTSKILAGGEQSLLYNALVRQRRIAQDVDASQASSRYPSVLELHVTARPGHTVAELRDAVDQTLTQLATNGPTQADLDAARNTFATELVRNIEDLSNRADLLNVYADEAGDANNLHADLARYLAITPQGIAGFVRDHLGRDHRVVIDTEPGKRMLPPDPPAPKAPPIGRPKATTAEAWRTAVPAAGPAVDVGSPAVQRTVLGNGMSVVLVRRSDLPLVTASVVSRYGSAADPRGRPGIATFTSTMLRQGTADLTADQVARRAAAFGGDLDSATDTETSSLTVHSLSTHAGEAVDLLSALVRNPAFREADRKRVAGDLKDAVTQLTTDSAQTARIAGNAAAYGPDSPYGHPAEGTEAGLGRITVADLRTFYQHAFSPAQTALVLAGDLTQAQATDLAQRAFGTWTGSSAAPPVAGLGKPRPERVVLIDSPGAGQTALRVTAPAVAADGPDAEALQVLNQVLGGLFSSRLNQNLRELHGYTYGVYSTVAPGRGPAPFAISTSVEATTTGASITQIFSELQRARKTDISAEELQRGRQSLIGGVAPLFATTDLCVQTAAGVFALGLPDDYYTTRTARLMALTPAGLREVFARHLDPARMKIVVVGDLASLSQQISALHLGTIAHYRTDGLPTN